MRILIVAQYFWPENFRINDIALGLKERGHEVTILTGKPNYPSGKFFPGYSMFGKTKENWNGMVIHRAALFARGKGGGIRLFLNYVSFAFFACWKALFLQVKADKILTYQQSPVTVALPAFIVRKRTKAPMFLYVQDLWPESIEATTGIKNNFFLKLMYRLSDWIYINSDVLLIQSKSFRSYLEKRKVKPDHIKYLPNSTEPFYGKREPSSEVKEFFTGKYNLVFAGNIGEAQSFDTLIAAAEIVKKTNNNIVWIIIGDGRRRNELEKIVAGKKLGDVFHFIGYFKPEMMPYFFSAADALILSLKKDFIFSLTIPSKLQSYMACGRPVIGSIDGAGAAIIREAGCGSAAPAEDAQKLADNILEFCFLPKEKQKAMGDRALAYYQEQFDRNLLLDHLEHILYAQ